MKQGFKAIVNRKTIGTLLLAFSFLLCFIFVAIIRYRGSFLSKDQKDLLTNVKTINGTYYTIDFEDLDTYALAEFPGKGTQNGRVPRRNVVQALSSATVDGEKYLQVDFGGLSGWLKTNKVMKISEDEIGYQEGSLIYIKTDEVQKANLYPDHAWSKEALIYDIPYGTEFRILETNSGWGKVTCQDYTGWINLAFTAIYLPGKWKVCPYNKEVKHIPMKKDASYTADMVGNIPANQVFTSSEFQNGMVKVKYKGKTGWVSLLDMIYMME